MKKYFLILTLLFLVGCSNTQVAKVIKLDIPSELIKTDLIEQIEYKNDLSVVTSLLSSKKNMLAYALISDCTQDTENPCNFDYTYQIYVKNLLTNKVDLVYDKANPVASLIPTAYAGGCPFIHLPVSWNNDNNLLNLKIIYINSNCGSGVVDGLHDDYTLNISTKEITNITTNGAPTPAGPG